MTTDTDILVSAAEEMKKLKPLSKIHALIESQPVGKELYEMCYQNAHYEQKAYGKSTWLDTLMYSLAV